MPSWQLSDSAIRRIINVVLAVEAGAAPPRGELELPPIPPEFRVFQLATALQRGGSATAFLVTFDSLVTPTVHADNTFTVFDVAGVHRGRATTDTFAGSIGLARKAFDHPHWEVVWMQPMATMLMAKVNQSSGVKATDTSFAIDTCTLTQPIGGVLNAFPALARNPFGMELDDNDPVLVLWDEDAKDDVESPWFAVSPKGGAGSKRAKGTVSGGFETTTATVSVSDFVAFGSFAVPDAATNCANPEGWAGAAGCTVYLDWRPDLGDNGQWEITGVAPVKCTVTTTVTYDTDTHKLQRQTRDVLSQWGGAQSDPIDIDTAGPCTGS